jgi:hypothetical protein
MGRRGPVEVDAARREGVQIGVEAATMRVWRRKIRVGVESAVWVAVRDLESQNSKGKINFFAL